MYSQGGIRSLLAASAFLVGVHGPQATAENTKGFVERVAPVLSQRCVSCHNGQKSRGGLNLTGRVAVLRGGDNGPAVIPGDAARSLLLKLVLGDKPKMPKQGGPLSREDVQALREWIDGGAAWPDGLVLKEARTKPRVGPDWWSLRPLHRPTVPVVNNAAWCRTPIDAFILATLESKGLRPAERADRRTLIRRLAFDLHGLPPTPDEVQAFCDDPHPDAYERLVDRLLASPHYGERWGRHWLDVVHYGDTHGYDKDKRRDHAWPYRDYVIASLNQAKPYSRFVREQLAGDVLCPDDPQGVIATGFLAAGPWDFVGHVELREGTVEKEKTRVLDRDDMVSNAIATFQSLTIHCARCHDHKFDPITQRDYYRLQAVFAGVDRGNRAFNKQRPKTDLVYTVLPHAPRPIRVLPRGDVEKPGELVGAGTLTCLAGLDGELAVTSPEEEGRRRAALADWLVRADNALTWRSIVNRVWHYHFGRGLVDTPNDFGWNGSRPSHPELLDWLAVEYRDGTQSLKALHRLILLSATYQQASRHDEAFARLDADNRYLWRMNRRRLDAESIRDAVLAVSGKLDPRMGGPGFELFGFKDDHSPIYDHTAVEKINHPSAWRRTVYRFVVRSVPNPFLECLDCADPNLNTPVRNTTLTALQCLALLNDPFMIDQAAHFAARLTLAEDCPERRVELAYQLAFGRPPSGPERDALSAFANKHGLANACRLLLNANEFVFID